MIPWLPVVICISLLGAFFSVISIGMAQMNKWLVDAATGSSPYFDLRVFTILCIVTLANVVVNSGLNIYQTFLYEKQSFQMRKQFYGQILGGDWQALSAYHSGDMMTRITSDVDMVANGIFSMIPMTVSIISQFITAFVLLYHYDWALALVIVAISPAGLLISAFLSRIYTKFQKESRQNESEYRSFMQESMENIMVAKSFSQEEFFKERMETFWLKRFGIIKRRSYVSFWLNMAMTFVFSGSYLIAFGWSAFRLSRGEISYGTLTLLLTLIGRVQSPAQSLQGLVQQMVNVLVSAGRIMEISELPQEIKTDMPMMKGPVGVCAENLGFAYTKGKNLILESLSFDIKPGETVGIVGSSGAGKTTLIRLLLALIKPESGKVYLYNDSGIQEEISIDTRSYYDYVPQGNTLMSGSIRENLLMGNREAEEAKLWRGLEIAEAADFVRGLPDGLDTLIFEKGGAISEGQAQRIAIARAVIKPGKILLLDEATASLDIDTETRIVENLNREVREKTCIVVTHRLSLLDICQRIYKIEDGKIYKL